MSPPSDSPLSLVGGPDDEDENVLLEDPQLRQLSGEGLIRYSNRGAVQLAQTKDEAYRRLTRRVFKSKLDAKRPAELDA